MPRAIKGGQIRRAQLITTYGVGSIVAVGDESFMVAGIDRWDVGETSELHEPRLERELGVGSFMSPPATEDHGDIPAVRFPNWVSCPSCSRLDKHGFFTSFDRNRCGICDQPLVPSRFVMACTRGHIDDFPYFLWVHKGSPPTAGNHTLRIRAAGASASLRDIEISCECGKSRTMEGALGRHALRQITQCGGRRPWLTGASEPCSKPPRGLQRGASNVWFPIVRSALSIPPWSEGAFRALNRWWTILRHLDETALRAAITGMKLTETTGYSAEDLLAAVADRKQRELDPGAGPSMREAEHEALVRGRPESSAKQEFACLASDVPLEWTKHLQHVRVITRLREVRALQAFSRILPLSPADPPDDRAPLYAGATGWLPAIEVIGEGLFVELMPKRLEHWEATPVVVERARRIDRNYADRFARNKLQPDREITPRLLLVHTLAHLLINQWSLDSGYPAASLRERLFVSSTMAGFMVYTATSDSAGSLGGLVAQAVPARLSASLAESLDRARWCSADPLCIESAAQGVDALNLAACHACALLPEVSCEEMNVLLDRGLVVGTPRSPRLGYFGETKD
jgi:hypothetical protein